MFEQIVRKYLHIFLAVISADMCGFKQQTFGRTEEQQDVEGTCSELSHYLQITWYIKP